MTIDEYQYQLPLPQEHKAAIGQIVAESGVLEGVIEIAIWQLLRIPVEMGEHLTNQPNLGQLVNLLLKIVPRRFTSRPDNDAFEPIRIELKAVVGMRNHLVHAYWTWGTTPDRPISLNFRNEKGEIIPRQKDWSATELDRVAARISRVGDELIAFLEARGVSTPPYRNRDWRPYQLPPEPKWPPKSGRRV